MNKGALRGYGDNFAAQALLTGDLGDPLNQYAGQLLAIGEEIVDRRMVLSSSAVTLPSQSLRLAYFTARKTEIITQARVWSGNTAAGATPTLVRWGVWTVGGNGELTLTAAIASDTSLFAATATAYTKAFQSPWTKQRGVRYAFGILCVTAAAVPTILGSAPLNAGAASATTEGSTAPLLFTAVSGQSDLPAGIPLASRAGTSVGGAYAVLLP